MKLNEPGGDFLRTYISNTQLFITVSNAVGYPRLPHVADKYVLGTVGDLCPRVANVTQTE